MAKEDEKLAEAMLKLAEALNRVSDPETWRALMEISVSRLGEGLRALQLGTTPIVSMLQATPGTTGPLPSEPQLGRVVELGVVLTQEERERMTASVVEALRPQLAQFQDFVQQAVGELPADKLKEAARRVEAGEPVALQRRQGCVFLHFPNEDPACSESFYLRL